MTRIRVTYDPRRGLVQEAGGRGFSINSPIYYNNASELTHSVSADHTVGEESLLIVDASAGDVTVTLPAAAGGRLISVKKIDASSNTVTLQPSGGETIDGGVTATITVQWTTLTLQEVGGAWYIR